jgi:hypothetical protein
MTQMERDFEDLNKSITDSLNGAAVSAAVAFGEMLGAGMVAGQGLKGLGRGLLGIFADLATDIGKFAIGYGVAIEKIKVAIKTLGGKLAIVAGIALVAAGAALRATMAKKSADITAFADGGIVSGPTLGLVGEYPGARTNPEVIAPLDKLRSMLGGQSVQVTGRLSGRDILLSSEYSAIDRNRVRGF